jgi:ribosomal-protein-alanine N-acetyltransferase
MARGPRLETARLVLDPFLESDAEGLFAYASDPEVARWMAWAPHRNVVESRRVLRYLMADEPGRYEWAIRRKSDRKLLGGFTLMNTPTVGIAEIHFTIAATEWKQGYATEAGTAVLDWAWKAHPEIRRIATAPVVENLGSIRVLEKLGFTAGETGKSGFHKFAGGIDVIDYHLRRP